MRARRYRRRRNNNLNLPPHIREFTQRPQSGNRLRRDGSNRRHQHTNCRHRIICLLGNCQRCPIHSYLRGGCGSRYNHLHRSADLATGPRCGPPHAKSPQLSGRHRPIPCPLPRFRPLEVFGPPAPCAWHMLVGAGVRKPSHNRKRSLTPPCQLPPALDVWLLMPTRTRASPNGCS